MLLKWQHEYEREMGQWRGTWEITAKSGLWLWVDKVLLRNLCAECSRKFAGVYYTMINFNRDHYSKFPCLVNVDPQWNLNGFLQIQGKEYHTQRAIQYFLLWSFPALFQSDHYWNGAFYSVYEAVCLGRRMLIVDSEMDLATESVRHENVDDNEVYPVWTVRIQTVLPMMTRERYHYGFERWLAGVAAKIEFRLNFDLFDVLEF